jgi:hypothetical protein
MPEPIPPASRPIRRTSFPRWVHYPSMLFLYGIGVPAFKLLEKSGLFLSLANTRKHQPYGFFGDYQPTRQDVLACVYFKSGTNWLLQILLQITHRGHAEFDHVHDIVPWPDAHDPKYAIPLSDITACAKSPTGLRVIKTHRMQSEVPYSPDARYICVVRDPKDVFVSSYHFVRSIAMGPMMPSVENWLAYFFKKGFPFCPWADHVSGFWQIRNRPNVLFLTYEEMKQDLPGAVRRIADLLQIDLTADELNAVVRQSGFNHMKTIEHKFSTGMLAPWSRIEGSMVRRGERSGSSELLTPAQQRRIDDHWRAELKRLNCDFPYDEAFGPGPSNRPVASSSESRDNVHPSANSQR